MYEEVYCPHVFRVRCVNLLTRCLDYAAVFPQLSFATRAIVTAAETSLAAMLRASITPYIDAASALEVAHTETTAQQLSLPSCLKLLSAILCVVPADTIPVLVALSSSILETALARLSAGVGAPRDVSGALQVRQQSLIMFACAFILCVSLHAGFVHHALRGRACCTSCRVHTSTHVTTGIA